MFSAGRPLCALYVWLIYHLLGILAVIGCIWHRSEGFKTLPYLHVTSISNDNNGIACRTCWLSHTVCGCWRVTPWK